MFPPTNLSNRIATHVDPKYTACFKSPISSFLSFIPVKVFNLFAVYSNIYAHEVMEKKKSNVISTCAWKQDIVLQEMMTFFGILLKMVLRPTPGKDYSHCWTDKAWHPYTSFMELDRFKQIRSVLHFNDISKAHGSQDAVFRVRPPKIFYSGI